MHFDFAVVYQIALIFGIEGEFGCRVQFRLGLNTLKKEKVKQKKGKQERFGTRKIKLHKKEKGGLILDGALKGVCSGEP